MTDLYGPHDKGHDLDDRDPANLSFAAESFEAFLCRFWLENEIWFADYQGAPPPDVGQRYIDLYRGGS